MKNLLKVWKGNVYFGMGEDFFCVCWFKNIFFKIVFESVLCSLLFKGRIYMF